MFIGSFLEGSISGDAGIHQKALLSPLDFQSTQTPL